MLESLKRRWHVAVAVVGLLTLFGMAVASAAELENGDYMLTLPGVGDFEFTVDSEGDEPVAATSLPDGYEIDDDDPEKAAWKNAASLEVEAKADKVEGDYDWAGGPAVLTLPGGEITVHPPDGDGNFQVSATGDWHAFGSGSDWYVANNADINQADQFFKVEATESGVEIKAVDEPDDGFVNDLEEEEEEEVEVEEEEEEEEEDEEEEDGPPEDAGPPEDRGPNN